MLTLANIKLMDTIVFVSGLVFGLGVGIAVGGLTWLVYGSVNPLGPDSGLLLVILIVSEMVYALMGSLARRSFSADGMGIPARSLYWGCLGLIGAFIYDLITIIVPTMIAGASFMVAASSLILAVPFMLAHEISDLVFFALVGPLLVNTVLKVVRQRMPQGSTPGLPDSLPK